MSDNIKPDYPYFARKLKLVIEGLTLRTYTSDELARELARLARTASEAAAAAAGEFSAAIEAARQEVRDEWQEKSKGTFQTAAKNDALTKENDDLRRQLAAAQALIIEAADDIGEWGCYVSAYFQAKHNLTGCIEKYRCTDTTVLDALLAQRERETVEKCLSKAHSLDVKSFDIMPDQAVRVIVAYQDAIRALLPKEPEAS